MRFYFRNEFRLKSGQINGISRENRKHSSATLIPDWFAVENWELEGRSDQQ